MIIIFILNVIVMFLGAVFSIFGQITTLPTIAGFNIDGALVTGIGQLKFLAIYLWPLQIMLQGFLAIMFYYGVKMVLGFILGHRAPGQK